MEFQKERVFTALNADELKIGSKVIVGDTIEALRNRVKNGTTPLTLSEIKSDRYGKRFRVEEYTEIDSVYSFAYLVSEPKEKNRIVYLCRGASNPEDYYLTSCRSDKWEVVQKDYGAKTKLFEGINDEAEEWYTSRKHLADVMAAWEDGKIIQYNTGHGWEDCCDNKPAWDVKSEYRIKPECLKWTDLNIGDIIRGSGKISYMITGIDTNDTESHIYFGGKWRIDYELKDWEKVE